LGEVFPVLDLLPDLSSIYRVIADLEEQGAVRSTWTAGAGGGRKTCQLTDEGWALLRFWTERFRAEQEGLSSFFERVGSAELRQRDPP
jgi:DNA-binding PadR family transcriptional regulator